MYQSLESRQVAQTKTTNRRKRRKEKLKRSRVGSSRIGDWAIHTPKPPHPSIAPFIAPPSLASCPANPSQGKYHSANHNPPSHQRTRLRIAHPACIHPLHLSISGLLPSTNQAPPTRTRQPTQLISYASSSSSFFSTIAKRSSLHH
jgi:hypothetical protein